MSKIGVSLRIDVTKINKNKLFKGEKGTYLDLTAFIDLDNQDQYGNNGMVTQSVTKEERERGETGEILGNTKVFYRQQDQGYKPPQQPPQRGGSMKDQAPPMDYDDEELIPF